MTTTLTVDIQTTSTLIIDTTQTAIIEAVKELDLQIIDTINPKSETMSTEDAKHGITLLNKDSTPTVTISTFTTKITSSSTLSSSSVESIFSTTSSTTSTAAASSYNNVLQGASLFSKSSSSSNTNIGLIIGIPVGVLSGALFILGIWFYLRKRRNTSKNLADNALRDHYDEKYNYKMSPFIENGSPYAFRSKYQVESKETLNTNQQTLFNSNLTLPYNQNMHKSELSLKEPVIGGVAKSNWTLNTPLSKWFAKHSQVSSDENTYNGYNSSRASLSTSGPRSPMIVLKEFKLNKLRIKNSDHSAKFYEQAHDKTVLLPTFPESIYYPTKPSFNNLKEFNNSSDTITQQVIKDDLSHAKSTVQKLKPIPKKAKNHLNKPLPLKPYDLSTASSTTLDGLEQRVYERMKPESPNIIAKSSKDSNVFKVRIEYTKNLADEITISEGEFVKILATHTDGWCLVEKCDHEGNSLNNGVSSRYINDDRGVVPEMCLIKT